MSHSFTDINYMHQKKYIQNLVNSASPEQLVILLYNGFVQWLNMAKKEISQESAKTVPNWSNYSNCIKKAYGIVEHLQDSLNHDIDPKFADDLFGLYEFVKSDLMKASYNKDISAFDRLIEIMANLKSGWQDAIKQLSAA